MLHGKTLPPRRRRKRKEERKERRKICAHGGDFLYQSALFLTPVSQTVGPEGPRTCLRSRPAQRLYLFSRAGASSQGAVELCLPVSPGYTLRQTIARNLGKNIDRVLLPASLLPLAARTTSLASPWLILLSHGHMCTWMATCNAQGEL